VARIYARIWASLAKRNLLVGAHDLIIAATAISLNYTVITSICGRLKNMDTNV
jgi:predicted nucleic acid-binding protein